MRQPWVHLAPLALLLTLPSACCKPKCRDESVPAFKRRATPLDTARLVVYGARNDCGDLLYESLDIPSRDDVGEITFSLGWKSVEHPRLKVPIVDLIKGLRIDDPAAPALVDIEGGRALFVGLTSYVAPDRFVKETFLWAVLYQENGEWRVNARETLHENDR